MLSKNVISLIVGLCFAHALGAQTEPEAFQPFDAEELVTEEYENTQELLDLLLPMASEENPIALFHLGNIFMEGMGVNQDLRRGFGYLKRSADLGYSMAQYNLAAAYKLGEGTPLNQAKALEYYLLSASEEVQGQVQAGVLLEGAGDFVSAKNWYTIAANNGSVDAQVLLARLFMTGTGTPQNYVQSYIWLSVAAASGDQDARDALPSLQRRIDSTTLISAQQDATQLFDTIYSNSLQ